MTKKNKEIITGKKPALRRQVTKDFYQNVKAILEQARQTAYRAVNFAMVTAYWEVGRLIVEEEQQGKVRAEYGRALIAELSKRLTKDFGKGFTARNLRNMRAFYLAFPIWHALRTKSESGEKGNAVRAEMSWTHYRLLLKVKKEKARLWYMDEPVNSGWSTHQLERQINSIYRQKKNCGGNWIGRGICLKNP